MKITLEFLASKNACKEGRGAFNKKFGAEAELEDVIKKCIRSKDYGNLRYANWLIVRCMNKKQSVKYAIYAAKMALHIYETRNPKNMAPRKAIEAAEAYLTNPCDKTKKAAAAAAAAAAYAAAAAAADNAADNAAYAADNAAAAAAAVYAAYAAYAYARINMLSDILGAGLRILNGNSQGI